MHRVPVPGLLFPIQAMQILSTTLFVGVLLAASAQATQLVKNINTQPNPTGAFPMNSAPYGFVSVGNRVYFSAATPTTGREYFWADTSGGPAQLLADIAPGNESSNPSGLIQLATGLLVFVATHPSTGTELWVSDGTSAGTQLLVDLTGPGGSTLPQQLVVHQGQGYFLARSGTNHSLALWRTDGTTAGTLQIEDLGLIGGYSAAAQMLVSTGSRLFYTASEAVFIGGNLLGTWRLYCSDGTPGGATLVTSVMENNWFGPRELTAAGSRVAWSAQSLNSGLEFWFSDGTAAGTGMVEIIVGPNGSNPTELTAVGSQVFFSAYKSGIAGEVFVSDGTAAGTYQVSFSGTSTSRPFYLLPYGNQVLYTFDDGIHGYELWIAGTTAGSDQLFLDLLLGPQGSEPQAQLAFQGGLLFRAGFPQTGQELFFSDGTRAGTYLVADINPGPSHSIPAEITALGTKALFSAKSPQFGIEPWITDGTPLGTQLHTDLTPVPFDQSSYPRGFANLGDKIILTADDGLSGPELWASDGTAAGTRQLTNFPGYALGMPTGLLYTREFDGQAIFGLDDGIHGSELWISDGTPAGTKLLFDSNQGLPSGSPFPLIEWKGEFYFAAGASAFSAYNLYATDGTTAGTRLVFNFGALSGGINASRPIVHGNRLYFAARTPAFGTELWSTDGTPAGTALVADINPGTGSSMSALSGGSLGNFMYFGAGFAPANQGLWRTDGTVPGTSLFDSLSQPFGAFPADFHSVGPNLVFSSNAGPQRQYFGTDGATVQQLSFSPLFVNSNWTLYSTGEKLIGMLRGPGFSFELWGTDGTPSGSGVIKQINPDGNPFVNLRAWRVSSGPKLLFIAGDSSVGEELFVTDGTAAGTGVLIDLVPGALGSMPDELVRLGNELLFNAYDQLTGWELYKLPWTMLSDWLAEPFGIACAGSSGAFPALSTLGRATPGATLTIQVEQAAALAPVGHFWSADYGLLKIGSCSLYLGQPNFLAGSVTDAQGTTGLALQVPNLPSLIGKGFWMQSLVADPGAGFLGVAALTPGLEILIGG
jgi:ELWxxDGT repeat protein